MKMLSNEDVAKIITVPECITIIEKLFKNLDITPVSYTHLTLPTKA